MFFCYNIIGDVMKKKLYKSIDDKRVAGVCGGIAEYLDIDSTIVRLIALLLVFGCGSGLLAYIVAAIIMPIKEK